MRKIMVDDARQPNMLRISLAPYKIERCIKENPNRQYSGELKSKVLKHLKEQGTSWKEKSRGPAARQIIAPETTLWKKGGGFWLFPFLVFLATRRYR